MRSDGCNSSEEILVRRATLPSSLSTLIEYEGRRGMNHDWLSNERTLLALETLQQSRSKGSLYGMCNMQL